MEMILNEIEARILGSLIEKEMTTPDYYPLTLNALTNACNQKSNRDPVMSLEKNIIIRTLDEMRIKKLVVQKEAMDSRVPKYAQTLDTLFGFSQKEVALICALLLRGPQTVGEIHIHTSRMNKFNDLSDVEATLKELAEREGGPFIIKLPRQSGQRESRYAHLFCGEVDFEKIASAQINTENGDRLAKLETALDSLRSEFDELRQRFFEFIKQFE
ncbi:MAG: YceH family protein [bacterium]